MTAKEHNRVPAIRFPEFSGDWEETRLGDILKIGNGKDYKHLKIGDIPVFGTGGYMCSVNDYLYDGETVCIGRKGTINSPVYYNGKIWTVDTLFYTHSFNNVLPKFIYNIFQNINWLEYNEATGVPSLSKNTIEKIRVFITSTPEQQKIADFLWAIDGRIQLLINKKAQLEAYKKGVMQQIFSRKLRFKDEDGNDYPDWEEKRLDEITKSIISGKTKAELVGKFPVYGSMGIIGYSDELNFQGNFLLIARVGANAGTIKNVKGKFSVTDNTLIVDATNLVNTDYLYFNLQYHNLNKLIFGSGQPLITASQLKSVSLILPSLLEQQKIASFLSEIDYKIELHTKLISQSADFKKGLLRRMFV